jgi:hypothetical protein
MIYFTFSVFGLVPLSVRMIEGWWERIGKEPCIEGLMKGDGGLS